MGKTSAEVKNRWNAKNYDRIGVMAPKGEKAEFQAAAEAQGQSVNAYILEAVRRRMESERNNPTITNGDSNAVKTQAANPPESQEGKSGRRGMTYIDRLNQFNKWVDNNYPGDKVISLYIRMLNVFNQRHWPEWAGITTPQLMALVNTSNPNVALAARNKLVEAGFLEYRPGYKGTPTAYKLTIAETIPPYQ